MAHNLAIPQGLQGTQLADELHKNKVLALPGQILTLGGALTSRIEYFWRQTKPFVEFDKLLAHQVVKAVVSFWVTQVGQRSKIDNIPPYQAMLDLLDEEMPSQQAQSILI